MGKNTNDDATRDATRGITAVAEAIDAQTVDAADDDLLRAVELLLNAIDARLIADEPGCALRVLARRQDAATASFRRALPAFVPNAPLSEPEPEPLIGDVETLVGHIVRRRN